MNALELSKALSRVNGAMVADAMPGQAKNKKKRSAFRITPLRAAAAVAALVALAVLIHAVLPGDAPAIVTRAYALETAVYPEEPSLSAYNEAVDSLFEELGEEKITFEEFQKRYSELEEEYSEVIEASRSYQEHVSSMRGGGRGLEGFFAGGAADMLTGAGDNNRVYSPLNTYLALAMLAEVTGGESRAQILDLLGQDSIDALRERANRIWTANYRSGDGGKCVPGSSIWLNEDIPLNADTLKTLAADFYSSSFQGDMGSGDYLKCMQSWLNEATGGLLEQQAGDLTMDPNDVLILLVTLWYECGWTEEFPVGNIKTDVFHSPGGDTQAEYMFQSTEGYYYWGGRFSAVYKPLTDGSRMWFILPDEGVDMDELLADAEYRQFAAYAVNPDASWEQRKDVTINLRLPKFDVTSTMDLIDALRAMGVTDCFDSEKADFTPLSEQPGVWVRAVRHGARLLVDEKGVRAASYVEIAAAAESIPPEEEVDFTLDRPFVFLLVSNDNIPLYTGVVNQP